MVKLKNYVLLFKKYSNSEGVSPPNQIRLNKCIQCMHTETPTAGRLLPSFGVADVWKVPLLESDCTKGTFDLTRVVNAVLQAPGPYGH